MATSFSLNIERLASASAFNVKAAIQAELAGLVPGSMQWTATTAMMLVEFRRSTREWYNVFKRSNHAAPAMAFRSSLFDAGLWPKTTAGKPVPADTIRANKAGYCDMHVQLAGVFQALKTMKSQEERDERALAASVAARESALANASNPVPVALPASPAVINIDMASLPGVPAVTVHDLLQQIMDNTSDTSTIVALYALQYA